MKVLFPFDGKDFIMEASDAAELVRLIHSKGGEVYLWSTCYPTRS